jgi:hypothetical protein
LIELDIYLENEKETSEYKKIEYYLESKYFHFVRDKKQKIERFELEKTKISI